ncbi:MAG: twin-arginine translocase subunit TatC [Gammaproteobacteria bacterium]|nr:twin-arginine translocase subunit TatC [Gammaproteobacteria bacterium]
MAAPERYPPEAEMPLIAHLIELRSRLLRIVIGVGIVFLAMVPFANTLYTAVAHPLMERLPQGATMISTEVVGAFLVPVKFTLVLAFFVAVPFVLYQIWGFVAPGLYRSERRMVLPLLVSSTLLFYGGMAFAYFVVMPMVFSFMVGTTPDGVTMMTDISSYLSFILLMFFAFGLAFEVPVATILLVWAGLVTPEGLRSKRSYIIVGCFVIAAVITPPDALSQVMLAVPMWLMFEAGLLISRIYVRKETEDGEAPARDEGAD